MSSKQQQHQQQQHHQRQGRSPTSSQLRTKAGCAILLLVALLLLRERDPVTNKSHWDLWSALKHHPPSLRIFRSLLEWNLLLWGTVASLWLWYTYIGRALVAELLFVPAVLGPGDVLDGDDRGVEQEAKLRRSTYSGVQFQDPNDESFTSTIVFKDPHASFSEVEMGTDYDDDPHNNNNNAKLFPHHPSSSEEEEEEVEEGDNDNKNEKEDEDDDDDSGIEEDDHVSDTPSPYDAQLTFEGPTVAAVCGAALDMLLPILLALFFFTLLSTDKTPAWATKWVAPVIPLKLVVYLTFVQLFRPWQARKQFFTIVGWTMGAPLFPVTFRDGFIGDIFTSTVRPLQDVMFTLCYIFSGLQGYWSDGYEGFWDSIQNNPHHLNDDDDAVAAAAAAAAASASTHSSLLPPLETSWFLHTVLLPMCMVSPLWWRFLQNLRQVHDTRQRWPYLGNAFKYLLAAEVAMFGVFDPSKQETYMWLGWFVIATLYQVWWDVFMDWELLVPVAENNNNQQQQQNIFYRWCCGYRLREKRLYPHKSLYTIILGLNFVLRFCWTLSFLPPAYLNQAGVLSDTFHHSDWSRAIAPAIASAEIIRRTLWGWIRLELQAIKVVEQQQQQRQALIPQQILEMQYRGENPEQAFGDVFDDDDAMQPMTMHDGLQGFDDFGSSSSRWRFSRKEGIVPVLLERLKHMDGATEVQVLAELSLWATVFATLGMVAAAHRMTY